MRIGVEHGLICSIVELGDIETPIEHHIKAEFFDNRLYRDVWSMLLDHYQQYGTVADAAAIHRAYPQCDFGVSPPEPIAYYILQVRDAHKLRQWLDTLQKVTPFIDGGGGPEPGQQLTDLFMGTGRRVIEDHPTGAEESWWPEVANQIALLRQRKASPGYLRGIATGFPTIDMVTGGFQPEQLITLVSTPKGGKSSFALKCALEASFQGYRVMFFTFEMTRQEQKDRLTSMIGEVGLTPILNGTITQAELKRIEFEFKKHQDREGFTIVSDPASMTTVSSIQSSIRRRDPQFVVIDEIEEIRREIRWRRSRRPPPTSS